MHPSLKRNNSATSGGSVYDSQVTMRASEDSPVWGGEGSGAGHVEPTGQEQVGVCPGPLQRAEEAWLDPPEDHAPTAR